MHHYSIHDELQRLREKIGSLTTYLEVADDEIARRNAEINRLRRSLLIIAGLNFALAAYMWLTKS